MAPQVNVDPFISWRVKLLHLELKKWSGGEGFQLHPIGLCPSESVPPQQDEPAD